MSLPVDVWAARLAATLHVFADDKKARAGARWLMNAAQEAGVEPRIGQVTFTKVLAANSTSTSTKQLPVDDSEHPDAPPRKRARKRKTGLQARLRGLPDYYSNQPQQECIQMLPALPCDPLPLEPDLTPLLVVAPAPTHSYAAAVRSPLVPVSRNNRMLAPAPTPAPVPVTVPAAAPVHTPATALETFLAAAPAPHGARAPAPATEPVAQPSQPRRAAAQRRSWPSAEDTRKFVDAIVVDNGWDNDCRSRIIRFEADGQSFKEPRRLRAAKVCLARRPAAVPRQADGRHST